jgi:hypothetical protein
MLIMATVSPYSLSLDNSVYAKRTQAMKADTEQHNGVCLGVKNSVKVSATSAN